MEEYMGRITPSFEELVPDSNQRELIEERVAAKEAASVVQALRAHAGLNQQELARRLGVSQARISQLESAYGTDGPTYGVLRGVAKACGVNLAAVLLNSVLPKNLLQERFREET
jgi:transcriptional regulator with XRE-family HTH domain